MFRRSRFYIFGAIGAVILFFVLNLFRAGGDGDVARAFLAHAAAGEAEAAYALFHPSISGTLSFEDFSSAIEGMATYTNVEFPSLSFSTENGIRQSEVVGTGTTESGCESALEFEFTNGEIHFFDIQPLCRVNP